MSDRVSKRLEKIFNVIFGQRIELKSDTSAKDIPGWDSLTHAKLIITIEEEFAIQFSLLEIEGMNSIEDLTKLIVEKLDN